MRTVTLSIDTGRHDKLKRTSAVTRLPMSEVVRVALDRLWGDLGDLEQLDLEKILLLFARLYSEDAGEGPEPETAEDSSLEDAAPPKPEPPPKRVPRRQARAGSDETRGQAGEAEGDRYRATLDAYQRSKAHHQQGAQSKGATKEKVKARG